VWSANRAHLREFASSSWGRRRSSRQGESESEREARTTRRWCVVPHLERSREGRRSVLESNSVPSLLVAEPRAAKFPRGGLETSPRVSWNALPRCSRSRRASVVRPAARETRPSAPAYPLRVRTGVFSLFIGIEISGQRAGPLSSEEASLRETIARSPEMLEPAQ
jgi:hypothetical protein